MMTRIISAPILCAVLGAVPAFAGPVNPLSLDIIPDQIIEVKNDNKGKAKGKDKANAKGGKSNKGAKAAKAEKPKKDKTPKKAAKANKGKDKAKAAKSDKALKKLEKAAKSTKPEKALKLKSSDVLGVDLPKGFTTSAPAERDMLDFVRTAALVWAAPDLVVADTDTSELLTYRNCPPGLQKKSPPCVPPGLAKEGVTTRDWLSYDEARYESILQDRLPRYLTDRDLDDRTRDRPLLTSDQIAALYGLNPAPRGQKYALIDGMPTLLSDDEHAALLRVNRLAVPAQIGPNTIISPNAALSQDELRRLYGLPALDQGRNYAVLNGRLITLNDDEYELLQLLRISRAVL